MTTPSVLISGGKVLVFGNAVLTFGDVPGAVVTPPPVTPTAQDGGDGLTKKELAALKKKIKAAQAATTARRARAERKLQEALEAAWAKVYGPKVETPAPEPPRRLIGAVEAAREVASDLPRQQIGELYSLIDLALRLIERSQELQRQRDEEEEDDMLILLAA